MKTLQSSLLQYGIAILSAVAAAMITWSFWPLMQRSMFMFFVLAVMLSAWRGGHGPGLVSTVLGAILSDYLFFTSLQPIRPFDLSAAMPFFLFIPVGLLVSIVTAESRRTGRGLAETTEILTSTIQASPLAIISVGTDGNIKTWNSAAEHIFGWSAQEVLGNPNPIVPENKLEEYGWLPKEAGSGTGGGTARDASGLKKDGALIDISLSTGPIRDLNGNDAGTMSVMADITERKRAEAALQESEQRFRATFEQAAAGIAQSTREGKLLMVNQKFCDFLGYGEAELLGLTIRDITPAEGLDLSLRNMEDLWAGEIQASTIEKLYLRKDGSSVSANLTASVVRDGSGEPLYFIGVIEDTTERRQAEQTLLRLATAVEQAAETIVITDTDGTIQYANPAFERTSGYSLGETIGHNSSVLKSGKQDPAFYAGLWETIKRGEVWAGHFTNRKKDGSLYEEEATISPVRDAAGNIVNFVAVKRDVTKEVGLENQLIQAQKMEAVGQLAGGVAHDFNNLLTAVIGYSQLVLRNLDDRDPRRADIAEIEKAGLRAAELTGQLLAFSRKQVFQPKSLALNALVTDLQRMLRRLIGEDIDLVAMLDMELGTVKADPGQLQQVIVNLIVNARDAMPLGGKLTIETANVDLDSYYAAQHIDVLPGAYCSLAISDNGCGIDEETKSHIFEPFFTTKELGRGTGLGLSTVYGIVKQSGGYISVYSEPGYGTTFRVYLPRIAEVTEEEDLRQTPLSLPHGYETLLLVEDEAAVRELAARVLRDHGYTVLEASDPFRALHAIAAHSPDEVQLLVTDVVMPHMSGRDLAERLSPLRPNMRVLYVSGYTDRAIVHHGVLDEGTPFLQKPFTAEALVCKVRAVLDARANAG